MGTPIKVDLGADLSNQYQIVTILRTPLYPGFKELCPASFQPEDLLPLSLPGQLETHPEYGANVLRELIKDEFALLKRCIGIRELLAFEKMGVAFCGDYSQGKYLVGWRDVAVNSNNFYCVPVLFTNPLKSGWAFLYQLFPGMTANLLYKKSA